MAALFSSPKKPKKVTPPSTDVAGEAGKSAQEAAAEARRRAAAARGRSSTILASSGALGNVG
jgi:hypothetical protein